MQLTKRFFLMNAMAVMVSIALTVLAVILFVAAYTRIIGPEADMNDLKRIFEVRSGLGEIKRAAISMEFEQLLDQQYQQELSNQVKAIGADAVILKNREVLYSTRKFKEIDIEKSLMLSDRAPDQDTIELDGRTFMFSRADYRLHTGDKGVFLLLAPVQLKANFYLFLGVFTISFFILSFLISNFWVSYRFSRGIIAPVSRLKDAAVKISEGDLSGGITEEGEGEVKELCRTLELMRIKLKESIYLQQKYDENRTFLISSISHDLKTPVTSIKGYIEGIIDGVAHTPEKRQAYLETARSKAILVNAMIDDLLLYSKLDLGQIPYHFERTDLAQYFEDCAEDYHYEYEKANMKLTLINELKEPVMVSIDRERLKRVVQNILDNAKKFMEKADGRVDILLRETRTSAIIEIRDNGRGIPEEDLPHIFDRFYRADPSRKSADGSGLGLAIAKQIVEGHEGKIWVASTVGVGTRMMISLKKYE
ncbi:cell wall metabolism sensor histidine kinase WalK [Ammoniphilus sp. CFH 90114]|uniref:sensor histidine kinase n=1 Tax=Ammoniphilus sp. CFH 90114 TaxID=2493665 RepID=UPI00100DBEA2|nr:HAMP domain-containing sensor histidine kinase [Ammoniphilus sp. CFH 90114]RXT01923.1 HAMP domain-containing histidine kinase [Ammoniphilus sp. CFH 90114]